MLIYYGDSIGIVDVGIPRVTLYDDAIEEIVIRFVLCLYQVRTCILSSGHGRKRFPCTYLGHAAFESNPAIVIKDAFRGDESIHALVGVLVDEGAQLSLNLKLYPSARNFLHVLVVDDVNEEKVGHVLGKLLRGLHTRDAGFPWA